MTRLTKREQAEAIEQFGYDLAGLLREFDVVCGSLPTDTISRVNAIPGQDGLDGIAEAFWRLADELNAECGEAEEADDRRRDNPLEPDHRRLGQ
jgi:hypothetical protein